MKTLYLFCFFILSCVCSFAGNITDNINNYDFGQTVTLHNVTFSFPTNSPVNGYTLMISGIGTSTTNYYWNTYVTNNSPLVYLGTCVISNNIQLATNATLYIEGRNPTVGFGYNPVTDRLEFTDIGGNPIGFNSGIDTTRVLMNGVDSFAVSDLTYEFTNTLTTAEIQAVLDGIPTQGNGYDLTLLFGNGTYNITDTLIFRKSNYNYIYIKSIADTTTLHTNQPVVINVGTNALYAMKIQYCNNGLIQLDDINFKVTYQNGAIALYCLGVSGAIQILGCKFTGTSTNATSYGVAFYYCPSADVRATAFENTYYAQRTLYGHTVMGAIANGTGSPKCFRGNNSFGGLVNVMSTNVISAGTENTASSAGLIVTSTGDIIP